MATIIFFLLFRTPEGCQRTSVTVLRRFLFFCFLLFSGLLAAEPPIRADVRWVVYYSDKAAPADFDAYTFLVLDRDYHPDISSLTQQGKILLGYLSLGEAERHRDYFDEVKNGGLLLGENPHWRGSYTIDIRERRWTERIISRLIPALLRRGFDGVFLDTVDSPLHLERQYPRRYRGMSDAAVRLVRAIRRNYPQIKIMLNRGYEILPRVASDIDIVLGESVYTGYDFEKKIYQRVPQADYRRQVAWLKQAAGKNPALKVLTLDYWNPDDPEGIAAIYRIQRANGFVPYVATITLDRIIPEPRM